MTQIDQFESVFKAASKEVFHYEPLTFRKILVLNDLEEKPQQEFLAKLKQFLSSHKLPDDAWCVHNTNSAPAAKVIQALLARAQTEDMKLAFKRLMHMDLLRVVQVSSN